MVLHAVVSTKHGYRFKRRFADFVAGIRFQTQFGVAVAVLNVEYPLAITRCTGGLTPTARLC